jgi:phosphosulfolactate synthase (CoM biosynthesis protein A)
MVYQTVRGERKSGNIAPEEIIPLETIRLGLRGDTFFAFSRY